MSKNVDFDEKRIVYSDSTGRAEHAHIGKTAQQGANLELEHFEIGNFDQKMTLFRLYWVAIEQLLITQTKAKTSSNYMMKKFSNI